MKVLSSWGTHIETVAVAGGTIRRMKTEVLLENIQNDLEVLLMDFAIDKIVHKHSGVFVIFYSEFKEG